MTVVTELTPVDQTLLRHIYELRLLTTSQARRITGARPRTVNRALRRMADTELLIEARRQALERMLAQAEQLGANAVVNVRFTTSAITQGAAELYAYGTAVVVEPAT